MGSVSLGKDIEKRLEELSEQTGRPTSDFVRQAVEEYLDEYEDYLIAVARLDKHGPTVTLEQLEEELELDR